MALNIDFSFLEEEKEKEEPVKQTVSSPKLNIDFSFLEEEQTTEKTTLPEEQISKPLYEQRKPKGRLNIDFSDLEESFSLPAEPEKKKDGIIASLPHFAKALVRETEQFIGSVGAATERIGDILQTRTGQFIAKSVPASPVALLGADQISKVGKQLSDVGSKWDNTWDRWASQGWEAPDPEVMQGEFFENPSWARLYTIVGSAIPSLVSAVTIGSVTGSPILGAYMLGTLQGAEQYKELKNNGVPTEKAALISGISDVVFTVTEMLPLEAILNKSFGPTVLRRLLQGRRLIRGATIGAIEASEEFIQQGWGNLVARLTYDELRKLYKGMADSAIGGFVSGGMIGSTITNKAETQQIINKTLEKGATEEDIIRAGEQVIETINDNAEAIEQQLTEKRQAIPEETKEKMHEEVTKKLTEKAEVDMEEQELIPDKIKKPEISEQEEIKLSQQAQKIKTQLEKIDENLKKISPEETQRKDSLIKRRNAILRDLGLDPDVKAGRTPSVQRILQLKKDNIIEVKEMQELKRRLRAEEKAAKKGERIGRLEMKKELKAKYKLKELALKERKKLFVDYAEQHLTLKDRGKLLRKLAKIRTDKNLNKALEFIDKTEQKYLRSLKIDKLKTTIKDVRKRKLAPEFKEKIKPLLEDIDLQNMRLSSLKRLTSMLEFMERNPDNNIPESQLQQLERAGKRPLSDFTNEELDLLQNTINHYVHLNDVKNKLIFGRKARDLKEVVSQAITNLQKTGKILKDPTKRRNFIGRFFNLEQIDIETFTKILDGEENGVVKKIFKDDFKKGREKQKAFQQQYEDYIRENAGVVDSSMSEYLNKNYKNAKHIDYTLENGQKISITPAQRIALSLHNLNPKNMKAILKNGMTMGQENIARVKFTEQDITNIINDMTAKEKQLADVIHRWLNTHQKKGINDTSVALDRYERAVEEDYFPMRRNARLIKKDVTKRIKNFVNFILEEMGILKPRIGGNAPLVLEDAFIAVDRVSQLAANYIGFAEPLRNAKLLLQNENFKQTLFQFKGIDAIEYLENFIVTEEGRYVDTSYIDKMVQRWINKIDVALLTRPSTWAKQPVSFLLARNEIKGRYLILALTRKKKNIKFMSDNSVLLRDRYKGNMTREMGELTRVGKTMHNWTGKTLASQKILKPLKIGDSLAVGYIWNAAEIETETEHPELTPEEKLERTRKRTEYIVSRTQPSYDSIDRSPLLKTENQFVKLLTKYSTQLNRNYNMVYDAIGKYNRSNKSINAKAKLIADVANIAVVNTVLITLIGRGMKWVYGWDKEEKVGEEQGKMWDWLGDYVINLSGNILTINNVVRPTIIALQRESYNVDPNLNILTDSVLKIGDAIAKGVAASRQYRNVVIGPGGEEKWQTSTMRAIDDLVTTFSRFMGAPYEGIKQAYKIGEATIGKILQEDDSLNDLPKYSRFDQALAGFTDIPKTPHKLEIDFSFLNKKGE